MCPRLDEGPRSSTLYAIALRLVRRTRRWCYARLRKRCMSACDDRKAVNRKEHKENHSSQKQEKDTTRVSVSAENGTYPKESSALRTDKYARIESDHWQGVCAAI